MSRWYAIAALQDARDATEDLLRPLDRRRWLRLALIALFVGVGGSVPTGGNADLPSGGGGGDAPSNFPTMSMPELDAAFAFVIGIVAVLLVLVLLWNLVGAVMEFVLVDGLRDRNVRIRGRFGDNLRRGLRLFGFRLAVGLVSLLVITVPVAAVIALGVGLSPLLLLLLVPLVVLFGVLSLVGSVAIGLTTDFAVPAMLVEDRGVLDSWRRLWPTLRAEWKQVGIYVVAKFVLGIGVSLAVTIAVVIAALAVGVPFAIVGGLLFVATSAAGVGHVGLVIAVPLVALFVLVMIVIGLLVQVPALTFVRYYSLSVLGMFLPELDLVGVAPPENGDEKSDGADAEPPTDGTGSDVDTDPAEDTGTDDDGTDRTA